MKLETRCYGVLLMILIVTASGCQVTPPAKPADDASRSAEAAARSTSAGVQSELDAIEALIEAGDTSQATARLSAVDLERLRDSLLFASQRVHVLLALAVGDADGADAWLDLMQPTRAAERRQYTRLAARIAAAERRYAEAATLLMNADAGWDGELQSVNDEIWGYVTRTSPSEITRLSEQARTDRARGWWALADALLGSFDVDDERATLASWQRSMGAHPAATHPPGALMALRGSIRSPRRIALVVPLSGPLAAAGAAVRDGFFAAFYRSSGDHTIRVYDSESDAFAPLYERIVADGMDVIVGPLDKAGVSAANQHAGRLLPTLALNYLGAGEIATPDLLQLGLAIEDEAAAIVERLTEDGVGRVALFWSDSDWSHRAADQIRSGLADSTCEIVVDTYVADARTTTDTVGTAFLVEESSQRGAELQRILGTKVEFAPRRRHDIDAIVALTDSSKARALVPALAFHFARDLPIYAPSPLLQGASRGDLRDLEGARVTELPWRVYANPIRDAIEGAIPSAGGVLDSLYALGTDAYRIVDRIGTFGTDATDGAALRLLGATGVLALDASGAFRREPVWVVVRSGSLVALPTLVASGE